MRTFTPSPCLFDFATEPIAANATVLAPEMGVCELYVVTQLSVPSIDHGEYLSVVYSKVSYAKRAHWWL